MSKSLQKNLEAKMAALDGPEWDSSDDEEEKVQTKKKSKKDGAQDAIAADVMKKQLKKEKMSPSLEPTILPSNKPTISPEPTNEPSTSLLPSLSPTIQCPGNNLALIGTASQIGDHVDSTGVVNASRAIDGNIADDHFETHSVAITNRTYLPWWKVEWEYDILVQKVIIYNRGPSETCDAECTARLTNSELCLFDDGVLMDIIYIGDTTNQTEFIFDYGEGIVADEVMVAKVGEPAFTYLQLAEVIVCGVALTPTSLPSTQPTTIPSTGLPVVTAEPTFARAKTSPPTTLSPTSAVPTPMPTPPIDCVFIHNDTAPTADPLEFDINLTQPLYVHKPAISPGYYSMFTEYSMHDRFYTVEIFDDDCETIPIPSCPIIFHDNINNVSSQVNDLHLEFHYNQTLIQESDIWTANATGGVACFCVKVTNYLEPTLTTDVYSNRAKYCIEVDLLSSFNTTIDLKREEDFDGGVDFINYEEKVEVYQCDASFNKIYYPPAIPQGAYVQLCLETVQGSAFEVHSIKELVALQNTSKYFSYVKEFSDSPLTSTVCINSNTTEAICKSKFQALSWYYEEDDPADLIIMGVVKLDYLGRRRQSVDVPVKGRIARPSQYASMRSLGVTGGETSGIFTLDIELTNRNDYFLMSLHSGGSSSTNIQTYAQAFMFTTLVVALGWWTLV